MEKISKAPKYTSNTEMYFPYWAINDLICLPIYVNKSLIKCPQFIPTR